MMYRYAFLLISATVLTACGAAAEPPADAGPDAPTGPFAHPCFPAEGVMCPTGQVPYCYAGAPGAAPFDNCAPSCGTSGADDAAAWCCPFNADDPPPKPSCVVTGFDGGN